jgi:hypothetical protein
VQAAACGHKTMNFSPLMGRVIGAIKELKAESEEPELENVELCKVINP